MSFTAVSFHEIIPVAIEAMKAYGYDPKDNWKKVSESFRRVATNICVGRQYVIPDTDTMTPGLYQYEKMRFLYEVCRSPTMLKPYNKFCVSTNTVACSTDDLLPQNQDPTYDRYERAFYAPYGGKHHGICQSGIADGVLNTIPSLDKFWMRINVKGAYKRKAKTTPPPVPPPKKQRTTPPPPPPPPPVPEPEPEDEFHECEQPPVPPVIPKAPWPKDVKPWIVLGMAGPTPQFRKSVGHYDVRTHEVTYVDIETGVYKFINVTDKDVTKAYRKASLKYHPDKGGCAVAFAMVGDARNSMRSTKCRHHWARSVSKYGGIWKCSIGDRDWDLDMYDPVE